MKTYISITLFTLGLMVGGCASAQTPAPQAPNAKPLDITGFFAEVDKDHDGCITADEWYALGLPKSSHDQLVDSKGCITLAGMQAVAPPPGIDMNGDGKLSVAEFLAFDKKSHGSAPTPKP